MSLATVPVPVAVPARHHSPPGLPNPHNRHPSPLHPCSQNTVGTSSAAATASTRMHIANIDRALGRAPQPADGNHGSATTCPLQEPPRDHEHVHHQNTRLGLFSALNLPSLLPMPWRPGRNGVGDVMSPQSLTHLQRLLTIDSPRASPKSSIAARWRQLHGANGWKGLLDPLDNDLRRELLRCGDFVQAAYHAFHSLPSAVRQRGLLLPDRAYRPTKSLFATSALSLPEFAQRPNTPEWLTQRSSWMGYVAVCESAREIARMGRRDIVIVLRGSATCLEWAENLRTSLTPIEEGGDHDVAEATADTPKVSRGFLSLYKTEGDNGAPSLSKAVFDEVRRLTEKYKGEKLSITVVGHSLGAALSLLVADELSSCIQEVPPIAVVSFGGPKVGNKAFAERLKKSGKVNVLRIVNDGDLVTRVPGVAALRPAHAREGYEHVGVELKLDSRSSPCLRPDAGPASKHDLEAYLHLIDGFAGTGRPFRGDARRSVVRLLQLQKGNVKKEYVNRARELGVDPAAPLGPAIMDQNFTYGCMASPS